MSHGDDTSHISHPTNPPSCIQSSLHLARPKFPPAPNKRPDDLLYCVEAQHEHLSIFYRGEYI